MNDNKEKISKVITEEQLHSAPLIASPENNTSLLKDFLIDFAGDKFDPEDGKVTVDMIAQTVATEFPEFMYAIAEENFLRGYQLGLDDATTLNKEAEADTGNEE